MEYRCFHCGELYDEVGARAHFGERGSSRPVCVEPEIGMQVGDRVLYCPPSGGQYSGQELAGIIVRMNPGGSVNLAIFDPFGNLIQNPPNHIEYSRDRKVGHHAGYCVAITATNYRASGPSMPLAVDETTGANGYDPMSVGVGELPPGVKVLEHRPATAEEVAAAKSTLPPLKVPGDVSTPSPPRKPRKKRKQG